MWERSCICVVGRDTSRPYLLHCTFYGCITNWCYMHQKLYVSGNCTKLSRESSESQETMIGPCFFNSRKSFASTWITVCCVFDAYRAVKSGVLHCYPTERLIKKQSTLRYDTIRLSLKHSPAFRCGIGRDTSRPYDVQDGVKHTRLRCFTLYFVFFICLENRKNG